MIEVPNSLVQFSEVAALNVFIVFLRVAAALSLLPVFGERSIPVRVKLAIALAFTAVVIPAYPSEMSPKDLDIATLLRLCLTETLSGLLLGISIRLLVLGLQTAGSIAAQATSLAQIFGGATSEPMPAIGHVLVIGALALAAMSGLHVRIAQLFVFSFDVLPPATFPSGETVALWGREQVANAFSLAFTLAAPFIIISVLYNLTLGVINKAMPQLMVAFVGAPVITAGGLFLLFLLSPLMLDVWLLALHTILANPFLASP